MSAERSTSERLAIIETLLSRIEAKLEVHVSDMDHRLAKLERFRWYATGAVTVIATAILTYFRAK